jgi:hypothetical protein
MTVTPDRSRTATSIALIRAQHEVFAPGSSRDLHADRKAGATALGLSSDPFDRVATSRAVALLPIPHRGDGHDASRETENVVEDGIRGGIADMEMLARAVTQCRERVRWREDDVDTPFPLIHEYHGLAA